MRTIVWSDTAFREVDQVLQTLAEEDARAATLVADRIEAAIGVLSERPIGRPGRVSGTYEKRVLRTPYIVAYALSAQAITILHVIHGRRDWPNEAWPPD